jgi:dienelactone hydrolase
MELMSMKRRSDIEEEHAVKVSVDKVVLEGNLIVPEGAQGIVLFAHGSGSGRQSPRNRHVAQVLRKAGLGTLLIDLLTAEEEVVDMQTMHLRFDIGLLAERLVGATRWLMQNPSTKNFRIGYFGASTGAAAALVAAAELPNNIGAVVSRGGRPDLAMPVLPRVKAPTLLMVGGDDYPVIDMNEEALKQLKCEKKLLVIPGATHLFEEPGKLDEVARHAANWFKRYIGS